MGPSLRLNYTQTAVSSLTIYWYAPWQVVVVWKDVTIPAGKGFASPDSRRHFVQLPALSRQLHLSSQIGVKFGLEQFGGFLQAVVFYHQLFLLHSQLLIAGSQPVPFLNMGIVLLSAKQYWIMWIKKNISWKLDVNSLRKISPSKQSSWTMIKATLF